VTIILSIHLAYLFPRVKKCEAFVISIKWYCG